MRIIRKLLASTLLVILIAATNIAFCQSPSAPDYWQTVTASTTDSYSDYLYDTVISRTCGHSLTVSCARMVDLDGIPIHHQLVLRCMNHGNYFSADILKNMKDTVYTNYVYLCRQHPLLHTRHAGVRQHLLLLRDEVN